MYWNAIKTVIFLLVVVGSIELRGEIAMAQGKILYKANLVDQKGRTLTVVQIDKKITLTLEGEGGSVSFDANGGGTSTCRTIIEHNSPQATVVLSLAIPDPRAACRMLPSSVSIESKGNKIAFDEEPIKRVSGSNAQLRATVGKLFGKIAQEG
jgi:hypothetical protein